MIDLAITDYHIFSVFPSFIIIAVLLVFLLLDRTFEKPIIIKFTLAIASDFLHIICCMLIDYFLFIKSDTIFLETATCLAYILTPLTYTFLLLIFLRNSKAGLFPAFIPVLVSAAFCFLNIFVPVVSDYDAELNYIAKPLFFIPHLASFSIVITLIILAAKNHKNHRRESIFLYSFLIVSILINPLVPFFHVLFLIPTINAIGILFYFFNLNSDLYKCDTLTRLPMRQSLIFDLKRLSRKDMIILTLDLNNLKKINDKGGHSEGDRAIRETVAAMELYLSKYGPLYRTGGDEFMGLFPGVTLNEIKDAVGFLQDRLAISGYQIAAGTAVYRKGDNLEQIIALSDREMYENKHNLKS